MKQKTYKIKPLTWGGDFLYRAYGCSCVYIIHRPSLGIMWYLYIRNPYNKGADPIELDSLDKAKEYAQRMEVKRLEQFLEEAL